MIIQPARTSFWCTEIAFDGQVKARQLLREEEDNEERSESVLGLKARKTRAFL